MFDDDLVIANPRPVPPYLRDTDASACTNASKIFPTRSGGIPTPVSMTSPRNQRTSLTAVSSEIENFTATKPSCVNLMALDARFQHNLSQTGRIAYQVRRLIAVVVDRERQRFAFGAMRERA